LCMEWSFRAEMVRDPGWIEPSRTSVANSDRSDHARR
jgi:hypothetical protein